MTKQEEIRQEIEEYAYIRQGKVDGADEDYADLCRHLTSLGVMIKVDRELPEGGKCYGNHSIYEVPEQREEIIFHAQLDMKFAGYVATEPLIEVPKQ